MDVLSEIKIICSLIYFLIKHVRRNKVLAEECFASQKQIEKKRKLCVDSIENLEK